MSKSSEELKNKLAKKTSGGPPANKSPEQTVRDYLQRMMPEIQRALPKHLSADRLTRIAMTTIRQTPALLECNVQSLLGAVMQAAQLGLEPNILGQCYIIPFKDRRNNRTDAQFMIG